MNKKHLHWFCLVPFFLVFYGFFLSWVFPSSFYPYVREDGFTETLTVFVFLFSMIFSLYLSLRLKNGLHRLTYFILFLLFLFGLGEEISWGQRIFNLQSPDFFLDNNAQKETNFHNLKIGDVKINKLLFGKILGIFLAVYFLIFPLLFRKSKKFKNLIQKFQIPLPHNYHIICFTLCFLMVEFTKSSRRGELMEVGGACIFFLILLYPLNYESRRSFYFKKRNSLN